MESQAVARNAAVQPPATKAGGADPRREAFAQVLQAQDEATQGRYRALTAWRRDAARREGVPHYVIMTNALALETAQLLPKTLATLGAIKGIGPRRVAAAAAQERRYPPGSAPPRR